MNAETNATIKNNATRGCTLAGQYHLAGSSWHPYLPPAGFDTCAVCTCDVSFYSYFCFIRIVVGSIATHIYKIFYTVRHIIS